MQLIINPFRQRRADAVDLRQFLNAGCHQSAQAAESGQQALAALGTHPGYAFQW